MLGGIASNLLLLILVGAIVVFVLSLFLRRP